MLDPELGQPGACDSAAQPEAQIQAHSAPLALAFYNGESLLEEYQDDLFIAFHSSWKRSIPTGYKLGRLPLRGGEPAGSVEDFVTGWLDEEPTRPAAVQ